MPVIKGPKSGYRIAPWLPEGKTLIPTRAEILEDPGYGKITLPEKWPTWANVEEFFGGKKKKPTQPPARGAPGEYRGSVAEGLDTYTMSRVYEMLLGDACKNYGDGLILRPLAEMEEKHGKHVFGYENDNWMELAYDGPLNERLMAVAHETAAKRLRARNPFFDHARNEHLVGAETDRVLREYVERALKTESESRN